MESDARNRFREGYEPLSPGAALEPLSPGTRLLESRARLASLEHDLQAVVGMLPVFPDVVADVVVEEAVPPTTVWSTARLNIRD